MSSVELPFLFLLERAKVSVSNLSECDGRILIRDVRLMTSGQKVFHENTLYITDRIPDIPICKNPDDSWLILSTRQDTKTAPGIICCDTEKDLFNLCNRLLDVCGQFYSWANILERNADKKDALTLTIQSISQFLGNAAYLTDSSFKALAIDQTVFLKDISSFWRYLNRYGYLSYDVVHQLRKSGDLDRIEQPEHPILFSSKVFNNPFISYCLKQSGSIWGYLFVVGYLKKITPGEILLMQHIGDFIKAHFMDQFGTPGYRRRDYENFLIHSLQGELCTAEQTATQIRPFGWHIDGEYCVARMINDRVENSMHEHLCNTLERLSDAVPLIYDNGVVCVFFLDRQHSLISLSQKLEELAVQRDYQCAISDRFRNFQQLHIFYQQTVSALRNHLTHAKASNYNNALIPYGTCAVACFLDACNEQMVSSLKWGAIERIRQYDLENNTSFLDTLFCYLLHERNIAATSNALFIHRNTLIYRIGRIEKMLDCTLENPYVRLRAMLTLILLQNEKLE